MNPNCEERRRILEGFVRQLRDVVAARVEIDEAEKVTAIRVLARAGRNPRQIVRDVQSALLGRFDMEVGSEAVSVAQLSDELEDELSPTRFVLRRTARSVSGGVGTVQVEMSLADEVVEAGASASASPGAQARAAAQAALQAVHTLLGADLFHLVDVRIVEMAGGRLAVAALGLLGEEQKVYAGCCPVRLDEAEAAARATLGALNRHLTWYRQG
ncbi:MAG: hypothetical protein AB1503_05640 [Bacillota bacterium]|nr:hypothetical protein [Bacillota bacterium]